MDVHIRSKLKDVGLLSNPFYLYGWLDDNRELCQRHSAPNKMKMDGRNDESVLMEDSIAQRKNILSTNYETKDVIDATRSEITSPLEIRSTQASKVETSLTASQSDLDVLAAQVSQLRGLLAKKENENKQIINENRILELKCENIQREKDMIESYTKRTLARKETLYLLELQEYKNQLTQKQDKINSTLVANDKLKSLLAKQRANYEQIASENTKLESKIDKLRRENQMLQTNNNQGALAKNKVKHLGVLQECNIQVRQK